MCGSGIGVGGAVARVKRGVVGMNRTQLLARNPNIPSNQPHNGQNEAKMMSRSKLPSVGVYTERRITVSLRWRVKVK